MGLLSGIASLWDAFTAPLQNQQNYKNQQSLMYLQHDLNETSAENAFKRQVQQWEMENAYNLPANERARLESAGLNPALMYGSSGGAAGASFSSAPQASTSLGSFSAMPWPSALQSVLQMEKTKADIDYTNAAANKLRGDTVDPDETKRGQVLDNQFKELGIVGKEYENEVKKAEADYAAVMAATNYETAKQNLENLQQTHENLMADLLLKKDIHDREGLVREEIQERIHLMLVQQAVARAQEMSLKAGIRLTNAQIELVEKQVDTEINKRFNLAALTELAQKQSETEGARKDNIEAQTESEKAREEKIRQEIKTLKSDRNWRWFDAVVKGVSLGARLL